MALLRSLDTAVTGIRAQLFRIELVGENIANVDTTGFKSSRPEFSTILSQQQSYGSAPDGFLGGIDPTQIGQGTFVSGTRKNFNQGPLEATGVFSDLAIVGDGFFILRDPTGREVYTRDGSFSIDSANRLHDAASGYRVQGYAVDENFQLKPGSPLTDLEIPPEATGIAVAEDGVITGVFDEGLTRTLGQVALCRFPNPNGLVDLGSNLYEASANTGAAQTGAPGGSGRGLIRGGALEESNVDLAEQFSELLIGQRAFQANARTITTSDQLLSELVNLL